MIGESPILVKQYVLDFVKVRLIQEMTSCNENLGIGDFSFGDDELNWTRKEVNGFINGAETIQEIPKLEIYINYRVIYLSDRLRLYITVSPIKGGKTSDQDV